MYQDEETSSDGIGIYEREEESTGKQFKLHLTPLLLLVGPWASSALRYARIRSLRSGHIAPPANPRVLGFAHIGGATSGVGNR